MTASRNSRVLPLDGGINFRDLGGYINKDGKAVRWRKVFRCGHLSNLSEKDLDELEKIGVNKINDFRREDEQRPVSYTHLTLPTKA